jgi:hypothetical protein
MKSPPQLRLQALSHVLQGRHSNLGWTGINFDPYIADMIVRRLYITGSPLVRE